MHTEPKLADRIRQMLLNSLDNDVITVDDLDSMVRGGVGLSDAATGVLADVVADKPHTIGWKKTT